MKATPMAKNPVNDAEKLKNTKITPRSANQTKYLESIQKYDLTFAVGPAGAGKTFIPVMTAMDLYLKNKIKKIIVSRPAVEAGEAHGFLPGDINKKLAPWVLPVTELIEEAVGKERFLAMLKSGDFEVAPFTYMRGRTFQNTFVLLDEAQNTTKNQMTMFLTRIGEGTKVVICGDVKQNDMKFNDCGLAMAIRMAEQYKIPAGLVKFGSGDVVRSEMCRMWVEAFEKEEGLISPSPVPQTLSILRSVSPDLHPL